MPPHRDASKDRADTHMFGKKSPEAVVTARACTYVSCTHVRTGSPGDRRGQTIDMVKHKTRADSDGSSSLRPLCTTMRRLLYSYCPRVHSVQFPKRRCRSFGIYMGLRTILHILHVHFIESREITRISSSVHICVAGLSLHALWSALI